MPVSQRRLHSFFSYSISTLFLPVVLVYKKKQEQDVIKESVENMHDDSEIEEEIELEETSVSDAEKSKSKMERKHRI